MAGRSHARRARPAGGLVDSPRESGSRGRTRRARTRPRKPPDPGRSAPRVAGLPDARLQVVRSTRTDRGGNPPLRPRVVSATLGAAHRPRGGQPHRLRRLLLAGLRNHGLISARLPATKLAYATTMTEANDITRLRGRRHARLETKLRAIAPSPASSRRRRVRWGAAARRFRRRWSRGGGTAADRRSVRRGFVTASRWRWTTWCARDRRCRKGDGLSRAPS